MKKIALKIGHCTNELMDVSRRKFDYREHLLGIAGANTEKGIGSIEEMELRLTVRRKLFEVPVEPEIGHDWPVLELEDAEHKALCDWMRLTWRPAFADAILLQFQRDVLNAQ